MSDRNPASEALDRLAISPTGFVFDPFTGATFSCNPTGLLILEGLRGGNDLSAITSAIEERFDASWADLRRDVLEFVRLLRENGLLPNDFELE